MARTGRGGFAQYDVDSDAFVRALNEAAQQMVQDSERAATRVAFRLQNEARRLCPVDTGRLRSSITGRVVRQGDKVIATVGTNVKYAPYVEYGTATAKAQPFIRPAFVNAARWWTQEASR